MTELPKREEVQRSVDQLIADLRTLGLHHMADRAEAQRREMQRPRTITGLPSAGDPVEDPDRTEPGPDGLDGPRSP
jgi:hypothetical protein